MNNKANLPSAARWLVVIAIGAFVVGASGAFVTRNAPAVVSAAVITPATSPKRLPSYIARIQPLPAGSISAITPLPKSTPVQPVATAVAAATPAIAEPKATGEIFRVVSDGLNVRRDASSKSERIGSVRAGALVTLLARQGKWMLIESDGIEGWVFGKYLAPADAETVAALD